MDPIRKKYVQAPSNCGDYFTIGQNYEVLDYDGGACIIDDCGCEVYLGAAFNWPTILSEPERDNNNPNPQSTGNNTPNGNKLSGSDGSEYYDIILPCGTKVSCNDVIDALGMNFNTGEAFKGLWRKGRKPTVPASYDLSKTVYYASRELKREEQNEI